MAREQSVVARDFLGLGLGMGETASREVVMGKQNFLHVGEFSPSINVSALYNIMAMAGMKHSASGKAATLQHLPLRDSCDERFEEQIAENLTERPFAYFIHPLRVQDLARKNKKNGIFMEGDSLTKSSGQVGEEYCSSGGFEASATRTMIPPSKHEAMAASEMFTSPGMSDTQHDAPLTIFYAGRVNVFNNISAEQAQAIMHLASVGNVQSNMVDTVAATVAIKSVNGTTMSHLQEKSVMNGTAMLHLQEKPVMNLRSKQTVLNHANQPTTNMQLDIGHLNIPSPSSPGPSAQPLVPTALPHARKASLTRFLEKRRERARSKCPYGGSQEDPSLPEERLSSSNDPTCYHASTEDGGKKRGLIRSWMLESVGSKEPNISVN